VDILLLSVTAMTLPSRVPRNPAFLDGVGGKAD
jgi:hypothetical protein